MESPNGTDLSVEGGLGGYASSERSSSETSISGTGSSPTSTTHTSISDQSSVRDIFSAGVIPAPGTFVAVGELQYASGEIRVMADVVAQARKTGELPPTESSPLDSEAIIHDHKLLAQLRLARGDPAIPPPEEYTRLRVEAARRIRERDAQLHDEECQQAATKRVEGYLRVVGQERKYYDLTREIARQRGVEGQGRDMERITEEVMAVVEKGIGTTAESLDMTAGELDSAACLFNTVARSLGGTATTLNFAATNLNATSSSLESTLGVMATQIGTLNTQLLALTNILQSQPTTPTPPTKTLSQHYTQQTAVKDPLQENIKHAIREAMHHAQAPTPHCETSSLGKGSYGRKPWGSKSFSGSFSEGTAMKTGRKGGERGTRRRASRCRYVRIVIDRILG